MNKKGFTLVEIIAAVAIMAILVTIAGVNLVKKYNESKINAIIVQEEQIVQSGDLVVNDYCKSPINDSYHLQCDNYYQSYVDSNDDLIVEDGLYTKYICIKDLKDLNYYSEKLQFSGAECSGVVIYKIDERTDLQKDSFTVIKCGEGYTTQREDAQEYINRFDECFIHDNETPGGSGGTQEDNTEYTLTINFTELTPNGMKVASSINKKYKQNDSVSIDVPAYSTAQNNYTPIKHGSSSNADNFALNASRTKLTGTMPKGNAVVNIVYSIAKYQLVIKYKEFNDVVGNINFEPKIYEMFYGEEINIPYSNVNNFKIISPTEMTYTMPQGNSEVTVVYQQEQFNLTYDTDGGSACTGKKVTYNQKFDTLCTTTKIGYTFNGWTLENGTVVNENTINKVYSDVKLYAKWTPNKYIVTYYVGNGTTTPGTTILGTTECYYEQNCTLKTFESFGVAFPYSNYDGNDDGNVDYGWKYSGWTNFEDTMDIKYTNGQTIYYNKTYNLGLFAIGERSLFIYGGHAPANHHAELKQYWNPYQESETYLTDVTFPNAKSISGWSFIGYKDGWTRVDGEPLIVETNKINTKLPTTPNTITSKPNVKTFVHIRSVYQRNLTINYNPNGGTGTIASQTKVQYYNSGIGAPSGKFRNPILSTASFTLAANSFSNTGHTFNGWLDGSTSGALKAAGSTYNFQPDVTESPSKTMYAKWNINNYTAAIQINNSNYGSVNLSSVVVPYGTTYTTSGNKLTFSNGMSVTATPTAATGHTTTFSSWSSTSGTITAGTTITANFTRTKIKYIITTAVNNSNYGSVTPSISVDYGTTYTSSGVTISFSDGQKIIAATKDATGYTTSFTGWTGSTSGTVTGNKSLTANFSRRGNNYSVIYNCNGGTPTNAYSSNHVYGTPSALASNRCSKLGNKFTGWMDSNGNTYSNEMPVSTLVTTDNGSISLTAQWKPNTYVVTLNPNGGSVSSTSITTTYNISYNNLPTPSRTGYTFVGWFNGTASRDSSKEYKSYPWLYYADQYSDLYTAFGYNETSLENHYNNYGRSEGRRTSQYINSDVYTTQANQTLYAGWSPNRNTKYVVNHYKQNSDGSWPTSPSETQNLTGISDSSINFNNIKKSYTGFGYKEAKNSSGTVITSATVAADGSTVINMYYNQYYISVIYHPNGADTIKFKGSSLNDSQFQTNTSQPFHYNQSVPSGLPDILNPDWIYLTRSGYKSTGYWYNGSTKINQSTVFTGKELAETFGLDLSTGNLTLHLYAEWQQCAAGTYSDVANNNCSYCPASKWSEAGSDASSDCYNCPAGSECPGNGVKNSCPVNKYSLQGQAECTWCSSGYYTPGTGASQCLPKTYFITFNANGGSVGTTEMSIVYNTQLSNLPVPTRDGYIFFGWFDGSSTAQDDSTKLYKDHPMLHYSDYNFDLKETFGYDENALINHYETHGKNEPARYVGQYRNGDTWRSNQNITLYAGWYQLAANVRINGGVSEIITCVHSSDSSKNFEVTTNATGYATKSVVFGTYSCSGSKSGYSKSVTVTSSTTTINVFPDGAIYWYGNGDSPNDSLYAVSGGFTSLAYQPSGYGIGSSALRVWYTEHYDDYMYYYSDCTQYNNGYGGSFFSNNSFSMSGYSNVKTLLSVSRCRGSSCVSYSGAGSVNDVGIYLPTTKADNYDNSPNTKWTGTISDTTKSVSASGTRYFALLLKSGYYWNASTQKSNCSKTMISIKAIYRE